MIRIKICGVTTPEDAAAVSEAGADAIGINFIPTSPRCLSLELATAILQSIPPKTTPIALVDAADKWIDCSPIRVVQVYHWQQMSFEPDVLLLPVIRVRTYDDALEECNNALSSLDRIAAIVLDSYSDRALGGTGQIAPWNIAAWLAKEAPVILAGGLTPDNVAEAIRIVRPYGVDVCSGVEKSPGVKDISKVKDFIAVAREAFSAL